jgi:RNA polymerase sigma-70 factor (ECF subfamily)
MIFEFASVLDRAKQKDPEAQAALYCLCFPIVTRYVHKNIADPTASDEIISDIFVKVLEGLPSLRAETEPSFNAWVLQIARARVIDCYRANSKKRKTEPLSIERSKDLENQRSHDDPVQYAEDLETRRALLESMEQLTEEQRHIITERFVHDHDFATIGEHVGKTAGAVRVIQHRALRQMKAWLKPLLMIPLLIGALFGIDVTLVKAARPDSSLYPVRMWQEQVEHSLGIAPPPLLPVGNDPIAYPIITPTAVSTATPTATVTATATSTSTPQSITTTLPFSQPSSITQTPIACVFRTCLSASLP